MERNEDLTSIHIGDDYMNVNADIDMRNEYFQHSETSPDIQLLEANELSTGSTNTTTLDVTELSDVEQLVASQSNHASATAESVHSHYDYAGDVSSSPSDDDSHNSTSNKRSKSLHSSIPSENDQHRNEATNSHYNVLADEEERGPRRSPRSDRSASSNVPHTNTGNLLAILSSKSTGAENVENDHANDIVSDSDADSTRDWGDDCGRCRQWWTTVHDKSHARKVAVITYKRRMQSLESQQRSLKTDNRRLQERIAELEIRKSRSTETTWPTKLEQLFSGEKNANYSAVYSTCCLEENMSPHKRALHPDLRLRGPTREETQARELDLKNKKDERNKDTRNKNVEANSTECTGEAQAEDVEPDQSDECGTEGGLDRLCGAQSMQVLELVLRRLLVYPGQVVHAISRLDPLEVPSSLDFSHGYRLLHRVHIGASPVNITCAPAPSELLNPLLGRFAAGIGAKLQLVRKIELLWIGSNRFCYPKNKEKYVSRRTQPLTWLTEARRLIEIGIFIRESNPQYMRRKHETSATVWHMSKKTHRHPDFRRYRSLRVVMGMDYIYSLRGMERISIWDFDKWLPCASKVARFEKERQRISDNEKRFDVRQREKFDKDFESVKKEAIDCRRVCVRDKDFVNEINMRTQHPKQDVDARLSRLKGLAPLRCKYAPNEEEWKFIQETFERPVVRPRRYQPNIEREPTNDTDDNPNHYNNNSNDDDIDEDSDDDDSSFSSSSASSGGDNDNHGGNGSNGRQGPSLRQHRVSLQQRQCAQHPRSTASFHENRNQRSSVTADVIEIMDTSSDEQPSTTVGDEMNTDETDEEQSDAEMYNAENHHIIANAAATGSIADAAEVSLFVVDHGRGYGPNAQMPHIPPTTMDIDNSIEVYLRNVHSQSTSQCVGAQASHSQDSHQGRGLNYTSIFGHVRSQASDCSRSSGMFVSNEGSLTGRNGRQKSCQLESIDERRGASVKTEVDDDQRGTFIPPTIKSEEYTSSFNALKVDPSADTSAMSDSVHIERAAADEYCTWLKEVYQGSGSSISDAMIIDD